MIDNPGQIEGLAQDAVANLVAKLDEGAMATRFVVLVEVVGADGDRAVWLAVAPGQKAWDSYALLGYAWAVEDARVARDQAGD